MARLEISLTEELKAAAEAQAAQRGYGNAKAYLESLVSGELEKRRARAALERQLVDAMHAPAREFTATDWAELRRRFEERHAPGGKR